jgi:ABC-type phosphate transport system permease subunit
VRVVAVTLALAYVSTPSLTLVVFIVINIVKVRGSNLWRFLTKRTSAIRKKTMVFKWIIGSLERG